MEKALTRKSSFPKVLNVQNEIQRNQHLEDQELLTKFLYLIGRVRSISAQKTITSLGIVLWDLPRLTNAVPNQPSAISRDS